MVYAMRRRLFIVLFILLAVSLLVACSSKSDETNTTVTPVASLQAASPVGSYTSWTIGGQLAGSASMAPVYCNISPGYYQLVFGGTVNDTPFSVLVFSPRTGNLDFGDAKTAMSISASIGKTDGSGATAGTWASNAGDGEARGSVTITETGGGTLTGVLIYPDKHNPGTATAGIFLDGEWTCPSPSPT
jgi:hypothetical protein